VTDQVAYERFEIFKVLLIAPVLLVLWALPDQNPSIAIYHTEGRPNAVIRFETTAEAQEAAREIAGLINRTRATTEQVFHLYRNAKIYPHHIRYISTRGFNSSEIDKINNRLKPTN